MKAIVILAVLAVCGVSVNAKCEEPAADVPQEWLDMTATCVASVRQQIQEEIRASLTYLAMAAHFSRDTVNRPGFAALFFKSASEEREHAMKLMSYLLTRGGLTSGISNLITMPTLKKSEWASGVDALKDALRLEAEVTGSIKGVIKTCEDDVTNDYHLVDYLTGDFLEEQYTGQRDLAGKVSTLDKMMETHGPLGEFLFDKKLGA